MRLRQYSSISTLASWMQALLLAACTGYTADVSAESPVANPESRIEPDPYPIPKTTINAPSEVKYGKLSLSELTTCCK